MLPVKATGYLLVLACSLVLSSCGDSQSGASVSPQAATAAAAATASSSNTVPTPVDAVTPPTPNATSEPSTGRSAVAPAEQSASAPGPAISPMPNPVENTQPTPAESMPVEVHTVEPDMVQEIQPEEAPYQGTFVLATPNNDLQLLEGDENGLLFSVSVQRQSGHNRSIDLNITTTDTTINVTSDLELSLSQETLDLTETTVIARAILPVSMAPITSELKDLVITATDGFRQQSMTVPVRIQPVPAPDVYLLIGQSNMVGTSEDGGKNSSPGGPDEVSSRIQQLNVLQNSELLFTTPEQFRDPAFNIAAPTFITAEDPLHEPLFPGRSLKEGTRIGAGLSFAKSMLEYTSQNVVLVPAAWSASGFCKSHNPLLGWNTTTGKGDEFGTTLLLERAMVRLNMALLESGGIFRGVLWHQGEGDSNTSVCAARYRENLTSLIQHIRSNALTDRRGSSARGTNAAIPFVIGTMSKGDDERGMFSLFGADKQRVDDAHRTLQDSVNYVTHVSADDLVPPAYPCGESSCVHFGSQAYRELGYRMHLGMRRLQTIE